jgi:hypothetical protein
MIAMTWSDTFLGILKDNDVRLISYVPDNVLTPLLKSVADIVAVVRGARISNAEWVRDEAHFEKLFDRRFDDGGPVLLAVKIDDQPGKVQTVRDPALIRSRFMKGLGTGRGGALDA